MAVTLASQQRDIKAVGKTTAGKTKTVSITGVTLDYADNGTGLDTLGAAFNEMYADVATFNPMKTVDTKTYNIE